jgi:murein L,D-transpeptidase YcbB/YkuD
VNFSQFERLLATSALGLALSLAALPGYAQQNDQAQVALPMPDYPVSLPGTSAQAPAQLSHAEQPNDQTQVAFPMPDYPVSLPAAADAGPAPTETPAATTTPEPAKAAAAATPDMTAEVADKIRDVITGRSFDRVIARKADRESVEVFYKVRDYNPLWIANGAADDRAKAAIAYLAHVDTVGLDPNDYPAPNFATAKTPEALAEAELKFTNSVLTYARQAQIGRIHFSRVGADIEFKLVPPEPDKVLAKLAETSDVGAALDSYNPPQPEFKALKEKLAELRQGPVATSSEVKPKTVVRVPDGKILRPGMKDPRVVMLRKRLEIAGDQNSTLYDDDVREAVKAFQTANDLDVDGNVGPQTIAALNGQQVQIKRPSANPIDTIIVNMERWRWFPRDLGNPHVIVNVPDYTLTLYNDGKVYWHTKIVAGQPAKATPMVSAEMKFITVNPTWNVPPSIIENEYLPALQQDPEALDRIGLKITQDPDGTVHIWQPPGAANALGRIRFNFPNKFLVYQHDTPDKYLFAREKRAYSHGCMRVQDPFTYGQKLLSLVDPEDHYSEAKLQSMLGDNEININFPKPIWVHLTYQTAFVDQDGKLQFREDVYGRDARMIAILKGSDRKVADIAIERPPNQSSKPVKIAPGTFGTSYASSGPSFFDMLFGGGRAQAEQSQQFYRPRGFIGPGASNNRSFWR